MVTDDDFTLDAAPARDGAISAWAEGGAAMAVLVPSPMDALAGDGCHLHPDHCRSALRHARVAVADHERTPAQVADLLLMLGLANDNDLAVEPLTEKKPERRHK
jgi:hypothetical protein